MRLSGKILRIFALLLAIGWILYFLFGNFLIQAAYNGKAPAFFSRLIEGQSIHHLQFYQALALQLMKKISLAAFALCIFVIISVSVIKYLYKANPDLLAILGGILFCIILLSFVEAAVTLTLPPPPVSVSE